MACPEGLSWGPELPGSPVHVRRGDLEVGLVLLDLIPRCAAVSQPSRHRGEAAAIRTGKEMWPRVCAGAEMEDCQAQV